MQKPVREIRKRVTYITKQLLIFMFIVTLFLLFLFLIGNFQEFQDKTQLNIIGYLQTVALIYLWLAGIHFGLSIIELIFLRVVYPGFLIFLLLSSVFVTAVRILFSTAERFLK